MFESISTFVSANILALAILALVGVLLAAYFSQLRFRLWVIDTWVAFPVIGTLARLSKDRTQGSNGWLRAEEKLCGIYKPFIDLMTKEQFSQRIEYLRKAADLGRTETPLFIWLLLIVLVIAEGLGFSYILGSWMAREGSAGTHTLLMFAIVLVLCVILVALTHYAGHQFFRTKLLRSCFARFKDLGSSEYAVARISLNQDQSLDNTEPEFKQIVNRVATHSHDTGSYAGGIIAIAAIIFIGVGSTYMRVKNLEGEMTRESAAMEQTSSANPFEKLPLPTEVTEAQKQADSQVKVEIKKLLHDEGMAAFALLGFIFVITQIIGMGAGYKYGFAGLESAAAVNSLGGLSLYDDYLSHFTPLRDLVNGRMKDLQQRIEEKAHTKMSLSKTFDDYLLEQKIQTDRLVGGINAPSPESVRSPSAPPVSQSSSTAPVPNPPEPSNATVPETVKSASAPPVRQAFTATPAHNSTEPTLDDIKNEFVHLNDPAAERTYFLSLHQSIKSNPELLTWLKERKVQRDALAEQNANELFG